MINEARILRDKRQRCVKPDVGIRLLWRRIVIPVFNYSDMNDETWRHVSRVVKQDYTRVSRWVNARFLRTA